ncbi:O-methyltransferase [Striga asiatica]|uniref:O-methyltransferase n=1 Tax=Striga asiatica TaxID=4170 RepID=A0A5A7Q3W4_STRAF|nr:O-methyltransferase [Striga asiatica]
MAMSTSMFTVHRWAIHPRGFGIASHCLQASKSAKAINLSRSICCRTKVSSSTSSTNTVVATDENYGRKEVISVNPRIYDYLMANVREPEILRELREETAKMQGSQMQGYSSLAVALVLPEGGQLVACERDERSLEVAQRYYSRAGVSNKVKVKHGLAADTLKSMVQNGEGSSYDFAFVDADKRMYQDYFELLLQLVRVGGLIVIDNVLWHGRVADPLVNDAKTLSVRNFNRKLMEDDRVTISMGNFWERFVYHPYIGSKNYKYERDVGFELSRIHICGVENLEVSSYKLSNYCTKEGLIERRICPCLYEKPKDNAVYENEKTY